MTAARITDEQLSEERRSNAKGFWKKERRKSSLKIGLKNKECGVENRNHSGKLHGKLPCLQGSSRF